MKPPFQQQAGFSTRQVYAFMVLLLAGVWLHIGYQQFVGGRQGAALALRREGHLRCGAGAGEWIAEQVQATLAPFRDKGGITRAEVAEAGGLGAAVTVKIEGGRINRDEWPHAGDLEWFQDKLYALLVRAHARYTLPDTTFVANLMDEPRVKVAAADWVYKQRFPDSMKTRHEAHRNLVPVFSVSNAPKLGYRDIEFPDVRFVHWGEDLEKLRRAKAKFNGGRARRQGLRDVCVWRGSTTGQHQPDQGLEEFGKGWRARFIKEAAKHRGTDARFTSFAYGEVKEVKRAWKRHFGGKIPQEDMLLKYRCVFDVDGNSYSQRLKFLLNANGVIVKQESPYTEFFTRFVLPWKHYVPMNPDSSGMGEALDYLQAYPEAAQGIAANANCFVEQHLEMDHVLQYIQQLLVEYNKLLS